MMSIIVIIGLELLMFLLPFSCSLPPPNNLLPNPCNETCGKLHVPFPFFVNTSCSSISNAFNLSCSNSSNLFLKIDSQSYKVLEFFNDGLLVDFPGASSTSTCRMYNDLNSFGKTFDQDHYGISLDNVLGLYDCDDSSLCKSDCETIDLPGCGGNSGGGGGGSLGCCYPLSDHSIWHSGEGFSVFSEFGCRGFSSWAVVRGSNSGKHGVKLEWGVPLKNSSSMEQVCALNAEMVNATSVEGAVRCLCQDGFLGDGFLNGSGCLQSCIKNGQEVYGENCYIKRHDQRKMLIIVGILGPVLIVASLIALFYLLKKPATKPGMFDTEQAYYHSISFRKPYKTRLFSHHDLDKATKGFEDGQKLMSGTNGSIFAGVLGDGSHVAVHRLKCENEKDIIQVLSQIEILSNIVHRNMACVLGCCIESSYTPLVVYEYPNNGTLEEHLNHQFKGNGIGLDWYRRLIIAAETSCFLAFLHYEISPPIFHNNLKTSSIFLDDDLSVKIAGFGLLNSKSNERDRLRFCRNDVYDMGLLLLELISGSSSSSAHQKSSPTSALEKIRDGKLEEIVDPLLSYHEMPNFRREQVQIVADLATRCLLFGADGKLGMVDVVRELTHITKQSPDAGNLNVKVPALEETFSNSSLLQMISMSPDSMIIH